MATEGRAYPPTVDTDLRSIKKKGRIGWGHRIQRNSMIILGEMVKELAFLQEKADRENDAPPADESGRPFVPPTRLMRRVNLDHRLTKKYLKIGTEQGWLEVLHEGVRVGYRLTPEGVKAKDLYLKFMREFDVEHRYDTAPPGWPPGWPPD